MTTVKNPEDTAADFAQRLRERGTIEVLGEQVATHGTVTELIGAAVRIAIEADRAQLTGKIHTELLAHCEGESRDSEYVRGAVELAAMLIGYGEPEDGEALRDALTTIAIGV